MEKENLVDKKTQRKILVLDTRQPGLNAIWKPWEAATLESLMKSEERTTMEAFTDVEERGIDISRASVILFLERLYEAGFVSYRLETARGGYRRVYKLATTRTWTALNHMVIDRILFKLCEIFPDSERIKLAIA